MEAEITLYIHHVGEFVQGLGCIDHTEERIRRDGRRRICGSKAGASEWCRAAAACDGDDGDRDSGSSGGERSGGGREREVAGVPA
ncbi:hypothetical protein DCAR_0831038 [Daucus carota subsp. sativus]|uniref:Uncharacterized protein n=1 Tax=Daucus carota subsp. sativus TaxID=79200 RepID=A0A162AD57_DAUCS|nr:hypothetical protein DCAR_0831038 [Daucus carota subsp. sativus]